MLSSLLFLISGRSGMRLDFSPFHSMGRQHRLFHWSSATVFNAARYHNYSHSNLLHAQWETCKNKMLHWLHSFRAHPLFLVRSAPVLERPFLTPVDECSPPLPSFLDQSFVTHMVSKWSSIPLILRNGVPRHSYEIRNIVKVHFNTDMVHSCTWSCIEWRDEGG